jgi:membrane-bound lytic murein transglycosylase D
MTSIAIQIIEGQADGRSYSFTNSFSIGRDGTCEVQVSIDSSISRKHAEVLFEADGWWLKDLNSTNGTYIDDERIDRVPIRRPTKVRLGTGSTIILLSPERASSEEPVMDVDSSSVTQYMRRYFDGRNDDNAGERTLMIRRAFAMVQAKQRWKYKTIIGLIVILLLLTGSYAAYLHIESTKQKERAEAIFYAMKSLELDMAGIDRIVMDSNNQQGIEVIRKYRGQRTEMEKNYDQYLRDLGLYHGKLSEVDRIIFRVARIFGECEVNMPKEFIVEVHNYIKKWQSTGRFEVAIRKARENNYMRKISEEMLARDLPPHFFYLALQESNFDVYSVGPETYLGYAKGMWQFIPETAVKYGLLLGPLADFGRPDPGDERHNFDKSTNAAARYIKFIYSTDAQASGLLVMSSYNWGERRVINLLRSMPSNPRERNFWKLLEKYRDKIPQETYDYVFHIFSAAVIGENPRLFGFKFDNPLAK